MRWAPQSDNSSCGCGSGTNPRVKKEWPSRDCKRNRSGYHEPPAAPARGNEKPAPKFGAGFSLGKNGRAVLASRFCFLRFFRRFLLAFLLLFLSLQFRADELEDGDLRPIADAPARRHNASIAAGTVRQARGDVAEELLGCSGSHQEGRRLPPRLQCVLLAEGDHALCDGTRGPGTGQRRRDALALDEIGDEVAERSPAMSRIASQF